MEGISGRLRVYCWMLTGLAGYGHVELFNPGTSLSMFLIWPPMSPMMPPQSSLIIVFTTVGPSAEHELSYVLIAWHVQREGTKQRYVLLVWVCLDLDFGCLWIYGLGDVGGGRREEGGGGMNEIVSLMISILAHGIAGLKDGRRVSRQWTSR